MLNKRPISYLVVVNRPILAIVLPSYIDHTILRPSASREEIRQTCLEAMKYKFYGLCVHGSHTGFCRSLLGQSPVQLVTVVGFPLGAMCSDAKACEAQFALDEGADELDMVMHLGALKSREDGYVVDEIAGVKNKMGHKLLKIIIETSSLNEAEIRRACKLVMEAGADYVKTSTGFGQGGATLEAVKLMKEVVGNELKIKASGGIKDRLRALEFIAAGASRIGTSSGPNIVEPT